MKNTSRFWECKNCGDKQEHILWSYEDLATKGEPVCPQCDGDMSLVVNK